VIPTVSDNGMPSFLVFKWCLTPAVLIEFLYRLMWKQAGRTVYVIVDGVRSYRSKKVRVWLENNIAIERLPPLGEKKRHGS
jgi:hypothetical protein